jgi:hypothetical protein
MNKPLKSLIFITSFGLALFGYVAVAEAGSGKCASAKIPKPRSGSCVNIKNCQHDEAKEDTANLNPKIRKIANCIISGSKKPMIMVSGYRCARGSRGCPSGRTLPYNGGANCSRHLAGDAIDARLQGSGDLRKLQSLAVSCGANAAVAYPCYNFVHFDTGSKRSWATCRGGNPAKVERMRGVLVRTAQRKG